MKSGGPWNLRGLRPETREAAREAARRSGMSVGEWLNSVIRPGDDDYGYGRPMRFADYDDEDDDGWRRDYRDGPRSDYRASRRRPEREAALAREEIGEVHARLDRLTSQLERLTRSTAARLTGAPTQPHRGRPPPLPRSRPGNRAGADGGPVTVDDAIAEIAERQRALYGDAPGAAGAAGTAGAPPPQAPAAPAAPAAAPPAFSSGVAQKSDPPVDISNLQDQLRYVTTQIESLRPSSDLERVIKAVRHDLADIRNQLTGALPRRDVESLETKSRSWRSASIIPANAASIRVCWPGSKTGSPKSAARCAA